MNTNNKEALMDKIELKLLWLTHALRDGEKKALENCVYELLQDNEDAEVQETPRCGDINCNSTHCVKPSSKVEKLKELQEEIGGGGYGKDYIHPMCDLIDILIEDEE